MRKTWLPATSKGLVHAGHVGLWPQRHARAEKKLIDRKVVAQAIKDLGVNPEMMQLQIV